MIAILHADKKWGIGKRNDLMFKLPLDMRFFKETTSGKVVCMGYNTLKSFPGGKPLKNRTNVVLCEEGVNPEGCVAVRSVAELLEYVKGYPKDDVFVIGGATVYKTLLPYCEKVYLTKVDADGGAEVFFPDIDADENFVLVEESAPLTDNGYTIKFTVYKNLATQNAVSE